MITTKNQMITTKNASPMGYQGAQDLTRQLFETHIQPRLLKLLPGELYPVEGEDNPTLKMLDILGGVDYFHVKKSGCIRGIASRVQYDGQNWQTFTVREARKNGARTELAKRKTSRAENGLCPVLTLQAYFSLRHELLGFAVARENDILSLIDQGLCKKKTTGADQIGQADFFVVRWRDLINSARPLMVYDRADATALVYSKRGVKEYIDNMTDDDMNENIDAVLSRTVKDTDSDIANGYEPIENPWKE